MLPISKKKLIAQKKEEGIIECLQAETQEAEARITAEKILGLYHLKGKNKTWNDFAVLVRMNNQADIFIKTFEKYNIPFQFIGSKSLFQQPEILDLISYLRVLSDPEDSKALYRVMKMDLFNFKSIDLVKLLNFAQKKNLSFFTSLFSEIREEIKFDQATEKALENFLSMIKSHLEMAQEKTIGQVLYKFFEDSKILEKLTKEETRENLEKISHINQFFKKIEKFERENQDKSVRNFVEEIDLIVESGEDSIQSLDFETGPESVKIMTVHAAKGLEFENVFVVNLVERRFPCLDKKEEIEIPSELVKEIIPQGDIHLQEEQRLFYVACTRAKKRLFFTWAKDYGGLKERKPSRFLGELGLVKEESIIFDHNKKTKEQFFFYHKEQNPAQIGKSGQSRNDKIENFLPSKFSFTQLKAFSTCPKQYKYAHILFIPRRSSHTFSYGKTIHNTLKKFYDQLAKKSLSQEELLKIYQENFISDFYESKEHLIKRKRAGEEALKKFFQKEKEKFSQLPLFLEKTFNLRIEDYFFKGVIDRLDLLKGNEVEIIDYKTGEIPKREKEKEQLLIYALAVEEVFNLKPVLLSYYYIDQVEKISFSLTKEEMKKTKEWILETIKEILQSDFSPQPGWHCQFCDFKDICEERKI